jgi:hypothetical protein
MNKQRYAEVMAPYLPLTGKPARCLIDGERRNIQVLDWPKLDEDEREDVYDNFGDIEEENVIGDYIRFRDGEARLRDDVVPFALVMGGSDDPDNMQTEGLLMLDLRGGNGAACPVIYADIDGTIDGNQPFEKVASKVAELRPEPGVAADDEDGDD